MSDELQRSMGKVEGKLDSLIEMFQQAQERIDKRVDGHDKRIGSMERKYWYFSGVWAVVVAAATYVVSGIKHS